MRIILDTNIWVSALLFPNSKPSKILKLWNDDIVSIIISDFIVKELIRVLSYKKLRKYITGKEHIIKSILNEIIEITEYIELTENNENISIRDHNDIPIIQTLLQSKADYLISGDKDVLELNDQLPIITLEEFWGILGLKDE